jgi:glutamate racemase
MIGKWAPIGVFDSGLGGLTVLKEIIRLMSAEGTIYLGDTARVPYGIRSPEVIIRYSMENTRFLMSRGIKLLVIACNTASAISLERLREGLDIPVVGVIEPGVRAAVRATRNRRIGVIGTETTIKSRAYARSIHSLDPEALVFSQPCPLFVPLVEEGWVDNEVALLAARNYLGYLKAEGIDTLVLGCTHYPLMKKVIAQVMGEDVVLIDSARETALEIKDLLASKALANDSGMEPAREFYATDAPEKFRSLGSRFLGAEAGYIQDAKLMEVWDEARWKKK